MTTKKTYHRSENLWIGSEDGGKKLQFEIRFSESSTRGTADGTCPRCKHNGNPAHWELEGPDSTSNTVWMSCPSDADCPGNKEDGFTWMRDVTFDDWVEKE